MKQRRGRLQTLDVAAAGLVACVVTAGFCLAYARTSGSAWTTPISYRGDALFLSAYLKAARDGHVWPGASLEVPELNAPFGANWNDHPRTLRPVFLLAGLASRALGLFLTMNGLLLLAHVLAGLTLYAVARRCGARAEWSAAVGIAFGLCHYCFWRSLDHLDLALAWHVPLCILVVAWAFSRRGLPLRSRRFAAAAAIAVVAAFHNPYYSCLFAQFLLLAALAQLLRRERRRLALAPLALVLLLAATFALDNAGSLAYQWRNGANPAAARPYGNLERFALKPIELVLPPPGFGLARWGRFASAYWQGRLYRAEGGAPYLGLVGAAALLLLSWRTVVAASRRPSLPLPPTALAVGWVVVYSILGGVNQVLGIAGFAWLRGTNRFSIWILALVLLYLATRRFPRRLGWALALGVAVLALLEVPRLASRSSVADTAARVASDRALVGALEALLPPGSMLFSLPVVEFPEGQRLLQADEYDHLRPYLHARTLRFSFGTDKGRPREAWQPALAQLEPREMARSLEACGFSGLLVDRRAYPDGGAELVDALRPYGHAAAVGGATTDFLMIALSPGRDPALASHAGCGAPATITARR